MKYGQNNNETIITGIAMIVSSFISFFSNNLIFYIIPFAMLLFTVLVRSNVRYFYAGMIASPFVLELVYFNIMGGTFRIGFFCSLIVIVLWSKVLINVISISNIRILIILFIYMLCSSFMSTQTIEAIKSSLFLILNSMIGFAACILLCIDMYSEHEMSELIRKIITICIAFGLIQYIVYRFTGVALGINTSSAMMQLSVGQIPGFRTEANTHGKLICWAVIFCLPPIINKAANSQKYKNLMIISLINLVLSMTRSATYAVVLTLSIMIIWYTFTGRADKSWRIILLGIVALGVILVVLNSGMLEGSSYSLYKLQNLFLTNVSDITNDASGNFRFNSFTTAFEMWNQSWKTRLVGVGYGQTWSTILGVDTETRMGGSDIMSILAGIGLIGELLFVLLNYRNWKLASNLALTTKSIFAEQMLFCGIYGFFICFFSGILACPEFWICVGCTAGIYYRRVNDLEIKFRN